MMPISKRNGKYHWGSKGPFDSRKKAEEVSQAAHASGYEKGSLEKLLYFQKDDGFLERYPEFLPGTTSKKNPKGKKNPKFGLPTPEGQRIQDETRKAATIARFKAQYPDFKPEDLPPFETYDELVKRLEQEAGRREGELREIRPGAGPHVSDAPIYADEQQERETKYAAHQQRWDEEVKQKTQAQADIKDKQDNRDMLFTHLTGKKPQILSDKLDQAEANTDLTQFIKFQKDYATTSSTGSSTGGPSYFNATYGDSGPTPKKKFRNATHDVTKGFDVPHEEVMFTSIESAAKAFKNMGKKTKDKAGAGRAAEFLDDKSPDMGTMKYEKAYGESHSGLVKVSPGQNAYNERKQSRRVLNTGKGGGGSRSTSGKTMDTTADLSHVTTLLGKTTLVGKNEADVIINSTFTTDLVKWIIQQSRIEKAGADQYGTRTLPNELPYNPMRGGDRNLKAKDQKGSPTTETSMPAQEVQYANMGQAGGFEAGIATHDPAGPENPANMTGTRPPDKGRHLGRKDKNQGGAYLASANQGGMNMQGMEKGVAGTGGGTPHVFSIVQPHQDGTESLKPYVEGKSDLPKEKHPDEVEERSKEKRKRDRKDAEPGMDGPIGDDAGAAMASIGSPIAQLMEKQGFEYEVDALHRGGSLDDDADLPEDDEDIEQAIRQQELQSLKQFAKMVMEGDFTIGKTYGL